MKKILILFLLITKPSYAGCFKSRSKPKIELTNLSQRESSTSNNLDMNNQEQERNEFFKKYLLTGNRYRDYTAVSVCKVLEPLKIEKLEISPEEATEKLKNLFNKANGEANDSRWPKFRQEAATLINSGADPNIFLSEEHSLLNSAISRQDYFFVYFLLNRGARCNEWTLKEAQSLMMTKLLISYGADPRETQWGELGWEDPLFNTIFYAYDLKLLPFYVSQYNYSPNNNYSRGCGLLHYQLNKVEILEPVIFLLSIGANPFKKNDLSETLIDIAKKKLESDYDIDKNKGHDFLGCVEEYNQIFRKTLIEQTKDALPLELQDYIYKMHAGEDAELY